MALGKEQFGGPKPPERWRVLATCPQNEFSQRHGVLTESNRRAAQRAGPRVSLALWRCHPKDASEPLQCRGTPQELNWATCTLHTSELCAASAMKGLKTLGLGLLSCEMGSEESRIARPVGWGV